MHCARHALPLVTGVQGAFDLVFPWPAIPAGIDLWLQVWIQDAGGPSGYAASNALKLTSQQDTTQQQPGASPS